MAYTLSESQCRNFEVSSRREWLLTNGIGGYAMGAAAGLNTRRYHGHLVAATNPPTERHVLLSTVETHIQGDGNPIGLSTNQYPGALYPQGYEHLERFEIGARATWRFRSGGMSLEKSLELHRRQNACTVRYRNSGARPFLLILKPLVCHKFYHGNFTEHAGYPDELLYPRNGTIVRHGPIELQLTHEGAQRLPAHGWYYRFEHAREVERGLDPRDDLFCPCELRYELLPGEEAVLIASAGGVQSLHPPTPAEKEAPASVRGALEEAAKHFLVESEDRCSIIAGYPWFTDWGRDTMISLPGICLHTGRIEAARQIILDYARQMRQGLIPNRFVESGANADYNTVDGTLWFANAIFQTLRSEWDEECAKQCLESLSEVFDWHMRGTWFGIGVDPADGLLRQGEPGTQLTWMDAKVGDWVVTPRHGKPVEINGLWINALRVMEWLAEKLGHSADRYTRAAERAEAGFEPAFWRHGVGHYLDTADPDDASLRPNQLIAMALPFGPARGEHARAALAKITRELLTPVGLRTLGPDEPGYRGQFRGPIQQLDASYHQGTVWPWLMGPYVTALVKHTGDRRTAKRAMKEVKTMLAEYGMGGIAEVYDGDPPHHPGGCPWQAWSVAEFLRAWVEDVEGT
ncbi:MAG TPA: amylo-alpha-1,6-glucosidase [Fimbriimonadaceae bacterium]|nr:amylo-alpha-1,6-glucosidase [Fimbriimonadaceae bacterium]